jgi:hypothetical protein
MSCIETFEMYDLEPFSGWLTPKTQQ